MCIHGVKGKGGGGSGIGLRMGRGGVEANNPKYTTRHDSPAKLSSINTGVTEYLASLLCVFIPQGSKERTIEKSAVAW